MTALVQLLHMAVRFRVSIFISPLKHIIKNKKKTYLVKAK